MFLYFWTTFQVSCFVKLFCLHWWFAFLCNSNAFTAVSILCLHFLFAKTHVCLISTISLTTASLHFECCFFEKCMPHSMVLSEEFWTLQKIIVKYSELDFVKCTMWHLIYALAAKCFSLHLSQPLFTNAMTAFNNELKCANFPFWIINIQCKVWCNKKDFCLS